MRKIIVVHRGGPTWTTLCVDLQKHQEQLWILCEDPVSGRFWTLGRIPDVATDALITREDLQGLLMPSRFLVEVRAEVGGVFSYLNKCVATESCPVF